MIAHPDDLAIHRSPIGHDILCKQMTTALKKTDTNAMQLGPKFSPDKCEAVWYRGNDADWNFKIAGEKSTPKDKNTNRKMNLLKVLNSL